MNLSAPKQVVWIIAAVLGILGIVGKFVAIQFISSNAFWLVAVGFVLLFLGTLLPGF
ncbi:MAG: hypothetical protein JRG81_10125 [Deltaproteobacteria bacterium]|nr:hypothetical protein [Deltaproteobacteria bacterium]